MLRRATRRLGAYTLIELLVVLTILVILVAAALPVVKTVMEDTRGREASRQLNTWLSLARSRAALTGRPCGLYFELAQPLGQPATVRQATRFFLAEVPPMYAGATTLSRGRIWDEDSDGAFEFTPLSYSGSAYVVDYTVEMPVLHSLVAAGDVGPPLVPGEHFIVRFDYKGAWYLCQRGPATSHPDYLATPTLFQDLSKLYFLNSAVGGAMTAPPGTGQSNIPGYAFQILRQPRRVGNPLEITGGSAVDMPFCGMGPQGTQFGASQLALAIMFMPGGAIESVWSDGGQISATGTVHLLIGKAQNITDPANPDTEHPSGITMYNPAKSNVSDPNSLWVSIGRNGTVTTSDNFVPPVDVTTPPDVVIFPTEAAFPAGRKRTLDPTNAADGLIYIEHCRELAIGRDVKGGR